MRMLKLLPDALMNMNEHVTKDRGSYKVLKEGNRCFLVFISAGLWITETGKHPQKWACLWLASWKHLSTS